MQLESTFKAFEDFFQISYLHQPFFIFVDDNTNNLKLFEINRLFNKQRIKKGKNLAIQYFIYWTSYGPK